MDEHITVTIPDDLLRRAKDKAADEGRSVDSLIEQALRHVIDETAANGQPTTRERKMPRVSTATGGLLPGIDITSFSDIQGMDDLEYAERLKNGFK